MATTWTQETVVQTLQAMKRNGEPVHDFYVQRHHKRLAAAIRRHHGTHRRACEAAGLDYEQQVCRRKSRKCAVPDQSEPAPVRTLTDEVLQRIANSRASKRRPFCGYI